MEKKQRVLIVEDEKNIVDILRFNLRKEGYDTQEAYDGEVGLALALQEAPDLILLDLMLPKMNGFEVCKRLRDQGRSTPVIIITAREAEKDKILGLDLGADDYITKPFSIRELMARVKANIRRAAMAPQTPAPAPEGEAPRDGFAAYVHWLFHRIQSGAGEYPGFFQGTCGGLPARGAERGPANHGGGPRARPPDAAGGAGGGLCSAAVRL